MPGLWEKANAGRGLQRPLEDPLIKVLGVSGSTDLGDGKPTLVLDLPWLTTSLLVNPDVKIEVIH